MARWQKLSLIWGGIWSGIGFVGISLYFTINSIDDYIVNPLYYGCTMLVYALQNWMFYTYLA